MMKFYEILLFCRVTAKINDALVILLRTEIFEIPYKQQLVVTLNHPVHHVDWYRFLIQIQ